MLSAGDVALRASFVAVCLWLSLWREADGANECCAEGGDSGREDGMEGFTGAESFRKASAFCFLLLSFFQWISCDYVVIIAVERRVVTVSEGASDSPFVSPLLHFFPLVSLTSVTPVSICVAFDTQRNNR